MSRTDKDQPWDIRYAEGHRATKCPERNCPVCVTGTEKPIANRRRRHVTDKQRIEEQ